MEKKGSDSGRGDAKDDIAICTNSSSDGVADVGLSTASCAVKEKELSLIVPGRVDDLVKGEFLLGIEVRIIVIDPKGHLLWVISQLLSKKRIGNQDVPILLGKGHIRIIFKRFARFHENALDEMEAIVKDVLICRI
jgi:hypothetical protein